MGLIGRVKSLGILNLTCQIPKLAPRGLPLMIFPVILIVNELLV